MTVDQFRAEEGFRVELATFLRSPTGLITMSILRELGRATDVPSQADALASARVLAQFHGYNSCIDDLERLAAPLLGLRPLDEPHFGADSEQGDQLPLQVHLAKMKEMEDARRHDRDTHLAATSAAAHDQPAA